MHIQTIIWKARAFLPSADGQVLAATKRDASPNNGTFYVDNFEYGFNGCDPGVYWLDQVYNPEGYADYNYGSFTSYNYYRRDHLGNNREV